MRHIERLHIIIDLLTTLIDLLIRLADYWHLLPLQ